MTIYFQPVRQPYAGQNNFQKNNKNVAFGNGETCIMSVVSKQPKVLKNFNSIREFVEKSGEKLDLTTEYSLKGLFQLGRSIKHEKLPIKSTGKVINKFTLVKKQLEESDNLIPVFTKTQPHINLEVSGINVNMMDALKLMIEKANSGTLSDINRLA